MVLPRRQYGTGAGLAAPARGRRNERGSDDNENAGAEEGTAVKHYKRKFVRNAGALLSGLLLLGLGGATHAVQFTEVGPGKVLQGLVRRIDPGVRSDGFDKLADIPRG